MSIRQLLSDIAGSVNVNPNDPAVSEKQRRFWIADGLAQINQNKSIPGCLSLVDIQADNPLVYFPRDYKLAEEEALLAVEYGYSGLYVQEQYSNQVDVSYLAAVSRPLYSPVSFRNVDDIPKVRVTRSNLYGVSRFALRLHKNFTQARTELLIYNALYQVTDPTQEITITRNPIGNAIVNITSNNSIDYTFVVSSPNPSLNQVLIGRSPAFTAINLAAAINRNKTTELVEATAIGQVVILTGYKQDTDYLVTPDNAYFSLESLDAVNNLTDALQSHLMKWVEYRHFDYLSTDLSLPGQELSFRVRDFYAKKANDLRDSVLDALVSLS